MAESHRMVNPRKILVKDLNTCLTCTLCGGYFIDATTVADCTHTFCRACIVRHFESSRLCPSCGNLVHKSDPLLKLRSDTTLQSLVYKVVPSLYSKELQRRSDFYHSTGFRANSSCSDDSVLGDRTQDNEEWVVSNIGDPSLYFSPDDSISLSVEYYTKEIKEELEESSETKQESDTKTDSSDTTSNNNNISPDEIKSVPTNTHSELSKPASEPSANNDKSSDKAVTEASAGSRDVDSGVLGKDSGVVASALSHQRFLQCPAAVRMSHLMKFLRMKFALSNEHRVDIIYAGEVLPPYLSLMDVAYTFKWNRAKPMRFFYLIYIPTVRAVVPQPPPAVTSPTPPPAVPPPPPAVPPPPPIPPLKIEIPNNKTEIKTENHTSPADTSKSKKHREIKIKEIVKPEVSDVKKEDNNNLKVSSKSEKSEKSLKNDQKPVHKSVKFVDNYTSKSNNVEYKVKTNDTAQASTAESCIYEYAEPDKDEIKAFAERRDREWAMQKYPSEVHVSKKRKKSKHSKNEFMHKKRKLHAEITSNNDNLSNTDDSLKLKVKLSVANGHKHKHRSSSSSVANLEPVKTHELSPKERLLQMRQVRHKQVVPTTDDKPKNSFPESNLKMVITSEKPPEKPEPSRTPEISEKSPKVSDQKTPDILAVKTLRSDFSNKTIMSKDICNKYVRVSLEKFGDKNSPLKKNPINNLTIHKTSDKEMKDDYKSRNIEGKTEIIPIENKTVDNNKISNNANNKLSDKTLSVKPADNKSNGSKILDNKVNTNNKILDNKINKIPTTKPNDVKVNERNNLSITENKVVDQKVNSKQVDQKVHSKVLDQKINYKPIENKIVNKSTDIKVLPNKTNEQTKMVTKTVDSKFVSPKPSLKPVPKEQKPLIDESKAIENKLNNIDFKSSQSNTIVTKNFTVSKVETGTKRKLESPEITSDKRPSLEITVINMVSRPPQTSVVQTNPVISKPSSTQTKSVSISPDGPPAKKIRPPPLTIPLGRIQKMNNINKSNAQKPSEKCDIFGALDLSAKPTNKPEIKTNEYRAHSASPKAKIQDQIQSMIRPKTPIKTGQDIKTDPTKSLEKMQFPDKRPNISNLQMLSESAVLIREHMAKGAPITSIPNLIKKIPSPISQHSGQKSADYLQKNPNFPQKTPNLIPKTPQSIPKNINNMPGKTPNFLSKNLQKLPKLNEINKGQFCRLNAGQQIRPPRPAGQNQTVRNIPNPSLLVRQQNQNRINSLNSTNTVNAHESKNQEIGKTKVPENSETEKRPSENKTSEPPPLKPIESFKK